jgi:copper chaperone NosL
MTERLERILGPRLDRATLAERRLQFLLPTLALGCAAVLLIASIFLPYWQMTLLAPQYPSGLRVEAYLNHLEGDVREIDGLNHYIGMRPLDEAAELEREMAIAAVVAIALLVLAAIYIHNRWAALLALPAVAFPALFLADLYFWMRHFGTNLDPTAPLSSSIDPFVPPVLGRGTVGQFATVAAPGSGLWLAFAAAAVIVVGLWLHRRAYKPLVDARFP